MLFLSPNFIVLNSPFEDFGPSVEEAFCLLVVFLGSMSVSMSLSPFVCSYFHFVCINVVCVPVVTNILAIVSSSAIFSIVAVTASVSRDILVGAVSGKLAPISSNVLLSPGMSSVAI